MQNNSEAVAVTGIVPEVSCDVGPVPTPANENYSGYSKEEFEALAKKLEKFKSGFVEYPKVMRVYNALERLADWGNFGEGNNSPSRCVLVTGDSGSGKTAVLNRFKNRFNSHVSGLMGTSGIIHVQLPSDCTARWLAITILRALGVPEEFAARGNLEMLSKRVEVNIKNQGVRLLILDEFHHLLKSTNKKVLTDVSEYIKSLLNTRACPIVMSGTKAAEQVYRENMQIQRRSMGHFRLSAFDWRDNADREVFMGILAQLQTNFPVGMDNVSLHSEGTAWRLHVMSEGNLGRVVDFLYALAVRAFQAKKKVDYDLLRETAEDIGGFAEDWVNPFDQSLPKEVVRRAERMTNLRRGKRQPKPSDIAA